MLLLHHGADRVTMTLREDPESFLCTVRFPSPKDGVENNAILVPREPPQCQPWTAFLVVTRVAWPHGVPTVQLADSWRRGVPSSCLSTP